MTTHPLSVRVTCPSTALRRTVSARPGAPAGAGPVGRMMGAPMGVPVAPSSTSITAGSVCPSGRSARAGVRSARRAPGGKDDGPGGATGDAEAVWPGDADADADADDAFLEGEGVVEAEGEADGDGTGKGVGDGSGTQTGAPATPRYSKPAGDVTSSVSVIVAVVGSAALSAIATRYTCIDDEGGVRVG